MKQIEQPARGLIATAAMIALAFLLILPWSLNTFTGIVSDAVMCSVPFTMMASIFWKGEHPHAITRLRQPLQGFAYLGLAAVVAVVTLGLAWFTVGGNRGATPFLAFTLILSVAFTFWWSSVMGGWPFSLMKNRTLAGFVLLLGAYLLAALVTRTFSFSFLSEAPFYAGMDPSGPIPAWDGLVTVVTSLAIWFLLVHLEMWPISKFAGLRRQPIEGLISTAAGIAIGLGLYLLGTRVFHASPDGFLVTVPVPFLFGTTVVLTMVQGSLTSRLRGVARGAVSALLAIVIGQALTWGYHAAMPWLTPETQTAPSVDQHIWVASALLGVTFPFLTMYQDFFRLWPLKTDRLELMDGSVS